MIEVADGIARYGYKAYPHQKAFHESTAKLRLLVGAAGPAGQSGKPHGRPAIASTETDLATLQCAGGWDILRSNEAESAAITEEGPPHARSTEVSESVQESSGHSDNPRETTRQAAELGPQKPLSSCAHMYNPDDSETHRPSARNSSCSVARCLKDIQRTDIPALNNHRREVAAHSVWSCKS
jgi:hypothetical protein